MAMNNYLNLGNWELTPKNEIKQRQIEYLEERKEKIEQGGGVEDNIKKVYAEHRNWLNSLVPKDVELIFATCGHWDLKTQLPREINNKKQGKIYKYFKPKDKHLITNKEFTRQLILKAKELFNHEKRDEIDQNKIISLYNQVDDLLKSLPIN